MNEFRIIRSLSNALSKASGDFNKSAAKMRAIRERQTEELAPLPQTVAQVETDLSALEPLVARLEEKRSIDYLASIGDDFEYRHNEDYRRAYGIKLGGKRYV